MAVTVLDTNRRVFTNLKYIYFTPWTSESEIGTDTYNLVNIVGDTTSVEQADNDVSSIDSEFTDDPLYENIKLGARTFTCECIDFQNPVLKNLFGWDTDDTTGTALAPTSYTDIYCKIELGFNSTADIVVLPKVKLNSKSVLSSMKTDASRGTITGTCYKAYIKAGTKTGQTTMATVASANKSDYTVSATAISD